ncbi:GspH/FimT family pseudopilin [Paraglaciecola sp. MB-3u-78]|uniref:GspH/FimT family pseudopilin n=1 Tax=Paraglaciecola sp. MB-3u-78 TaxID=2058332 RepID=UPI000C33DA3B|nr:GspH/FimT family pseudopilin [Paraglaciecola sp. MB-3u-78]PKH00482.1 pilus assembly protein [Paraglaciecola sp. MB-3u-78]
MKQQKGVTLVELMITVSIIAIILTFVGPSIQSILIKNRVVAEINETSSLIQYARHHAIDEQAQVVVCPSADYSICSTDWNDPKIVFIDEDDNAIRGDSEELLVTIGATSSTSLMTNTTDIIKFTGTGEANETTEILLCHKDGEAEYARSLSVTLQGRVKMSNDSDRNGINENASGTELSC